MSFPARSASALLLFLLMGCKETSVSFEEAGDGQGDPSDVVVAKRGGRPEFYASDVAALQKNANFFFRVWDETFSRKLSDLPKTGEVPDAKKPFPGGYYPEQGGGTDVVMVSGRSPLQKYDDAFNGGQPKAQQWEREKHTTGPVWAGHCNGYSAAAQRHPKEPQKAVTKNGVTFDPRDIKALLAEIYMNADYEFLGGNRCDKEGAIRLPGQRPDPKLMDECEDINPGTLHAAMANWIGRMSHTLIMDEYSGDQVWNYPIYKFEVTQLDSITKAQAKQQVIGSGSGEYVFNPAAVGFALVRSKLTFAVAQKYEVLGGLNERREPIEPGVFNLSYVLELGSEGEILGGEWVGESQQKHPDFMWVALPPLEPNGTRYMGNQFVNANEVIKLWAEAAGFDPEHPPLDLARPPATSDWGSYPGFEVTLDGNKTGAVFAGKPAHLHITRREGLLGAGVTLELSLNGSALTTITPKPGEALAHAFDPGLGLNRFQFTWKKDGATLEEQFLRFHVVR